MRTTRLHLVALVLVLVAPPARAADWAVAPASQIRYLLHHPFHEVVGVSSEPRGELHYDVATGGTVKVWAPVRSFHSGNANRDVHMLEVVAGHRNKQVVFEAALPPGLPENGTAQIEGMVTLKGVARPAKAEILFQRAGDLVKVKATLATTLTAHKIERPSLMLVKVDDELKVEADLELKAASRPEVGTGTP